MSFPLCEQCVASLVILATFNLKSYEASDVFTEAFQPLQDIAIIPRAHPVQIPQDIPVNMLGTTSPLLATSTIPDPAPEQSSECQQYQPTQMNGHQLLGITKEEIFYHLTTYPLTQSLKESMDCHFMHGQLN